MTNYLAVLVAVAAFAGTSRAADSAPHYQSSGGSLTFTFVQAGAESHGSFKQFTAGMRYDERNPAGGSLEVTVQIGSLDTKDKDRDDALAGPDLFDAKKYPTAKYVADSFARGANGKLEAVGKLTLRGVTRNLRIPLTLRDVAGAVELSGEVTIRRLDYGVGQGEWQSTEWVGDEVKLQYKVSMARSK